VEVRTAVVTGAASGIGARAVARMRARGVRVIAGDRNAEVETLHEDDEGVIGIVGDVAAAEFATTLVQRAEAEFGPVDRLFHSAGVMPGGQIADTDVEALLSVMHVNYAGTVRMTKAVLPGMRARGAGQIVVLGSITGYVPTRGLAAYSASKAAVNSYVEILAHEEKPHGIRVVLAAPNAVKTPLLAQATGGPKIIATLNEKVSSPLMITPDKVLDSIDRALTKDRSVILPGALAIHAIRRLSPSAMWALAERLGA
jgi:short-subunit dehydrogenase